MSFSSVHESTVCNTYLMMHKNL